MASLTDMTAGASVFSYTWGDPVSAYVIGNVPWTTPFVSADVSFSGIVPSHLYELHLWTKTYSNNDPQSVTISVSGFAPIASPAPEPEALAMMLAGLGLVLGLRRLGARLPWAYRGAAARA